MPGSKAVEELVGEVQDSHPQGYSLGPVGPEGDEQTVEVVHLRSCLRPNVDSLLTDPPRLVYISLPGEAENLLREHLGQITLGESENTSLLLTLPEKRTARQ